MPKRVTVIVPSYCPDETVKGYEAECLRCVAEYTPRDLYDLVLVGGGDWSYPKKVNSIAERCETEYIAILSNDVFVTPGWLETMIRDYEHLPKCGILAPMEESFPGIYTKDDHWWALVLIKTKRYRLYPLDETLPLVYHDQNTSIEMKQAGFEIYRTGNVVVKHIGMATRSRIGTGDNAKEREEMIRRWGVAELKDWVLKYEDRLAE